MGRKNIILLTGLLVLAIGGAVFTVLFPDRNSSSDNQDLPDDPIAAMSSEEQEEEQEEAQKLAERFGIPEAAGYEWIYTEDFSFLQSEMSIDDILQLPVYYFSVPEDVRQYADRLAEELIGSGYQEITITSEPMAEDFFPGWEDRLIYTIDRTTVRLNVSQFDVTFIGKKDAAGLQSGEAGDLIQRGEEFLQSSGLGFWKADESYMQLTQIEDEVRAVPVFEGIEGGKYVATRQGQGKDGYAYIFDNLLRMEFSGPGIETLTGAYSGQWEKEASLSGTYDSYEDILDMLQSGLRMDRVQPGEEETWSFDVLEVESAECTYVIGIDPDNPGFKAVPWVVVTGTLYSYRNPDQSWTQYEDSYFYGINLETGQVSRMILNVDW